MRTFFLLLGKRSVGFFREKNIRWALGRNLGGGRGVAYWLDNKPVFLGERRPSSPPPPIFLGWWSWYLQESILSLAWLGIWLKILFLGGFKFKSVVRYI